MSGFVAEMVNRIGTANNLCDRPAAGHDPNFGRLPRLSQRASFGPRSGHSYRLPPILTTRRVGENHFSDNRVATATAQAALRCARPQSIVEIDDEFTAMLDDRLGDMAARAGQNDRCVGCGEAINCGAIRACWRREMLARIDESIPTVGHRLAAHPGESRSREFFGRRSAVGGVAIGFVFGHFTEHEVNIERRGEEFGHAFARFQQRADRRAASPGVDQFSTSQAFVIGAATRNWFAIHEWHDVGRRRTDIQEDRRAGRD